MKKNSTRILSLLIVMIMILSMSTVAFAIDGSVPPSVLKASMQNANLLPNPTDATERALRGNYLPYTGYFEESFTTGAAAGRKARFYIPEGAYVRNYFLTIALPSGTDVEEFLINSGWIDVANAKRMCLMILLPNGDTWGTYAEEKAYFGALMDGYTSGRRWYSIYNEFYLAGYGDGGDILQQWAGENPLFVISQAYFDSAIDASVLAPAGEYYYVPSGQTALTSATPVQATFECVQKKDIPVPTYFFGSATPQGAIDYWKAANECDASVKTGAGPLGSDIFFQNKTNSKAIATGVSNVVSRVAVLNSKVNYVDKAVTQAVYDGLAVYTRYTNSSAWSNALGFRPDREALGIETVDLWTKEEGGKDFKRQYTIYVPEKVKDKTLYPNGAPVIYAIGGNGNNAFQYFESSQYVELADTYGFSVVMPSEHTSSNGVTTTWRIGEDEYNFVKAVMAQVNGKYGQYFDQKKIFVMGHSQGGGMTNYLSFRDPNLFTAYAVMAGSSYTFPAGTPKAPMYAIYGEYDIVNYATNRTQWLKRNNLKAEDGVITDPFDLPSRYGNPIEYLIYPDTAKYPGDKFVTTTWYDENGIPMFNDSTAYGREHNNTVPDARRIWTDWFSKWDRDASGNRVYNPTIELTTEAHNVVKGNYVDLNTTFAQQMSSNTATLTYTFDGDKFDFVDFKPASGVTLLNTVNTEKGVAKITVMSMNYDLKNLGVFTLLAKPAATFYKEYQTVSLAATYVFKDEAGTKALLTANAAALFTTLSTIPGDTDDNGIINLIDLSDMIDWFGKTSSDSNWTSLYAFYDFNGNGQIDISDIAYVAKLI